MTITAIDLAITYPDDVDVVVPTRSYDYNKGDRRFFDHQAAVDHAHAVALETGVRQSVRPDPGTPEFEIRNGRTLYLVQAVGS